MNEYELLGKNVPNAAIGSWYAADALGGLSVREDESAITRAHRGPHAILG
jgi:glutathionylspermidine synthase